MIDLNQERIVLYHGSNVSFEQVSLIHSKDKRDFGKGFYTHSVIYIRYLYRSNSYGAITLF